MGNYAVKWLREAVKKENVRNKGDNMNKSNKFMLLGVWVLLFIWAGVNLSQKSNDIALLLFLYGLLVLTTDFLCHISDKKSYSQIIQSEFDRIFILGNWASKFLAFVSLISSFAVCAFISPILSNLNSTMTWVVITIPIFGIFANMFIMNPYLNLKVIEKEIAPYQNELEQGNIKLSVLLEELKHARRSGER